MEDDPRLVDSVVEMTVAEGLLECAGHWTRRRDLFDQLQRSERENPRLRFDERSADRALERLTAAGILEAQRVAGPDTVFRRLRLAEEGARRLRALLEDARQRYERGGGSD